ncbi:hypothetical protein [Pseudidiomarina salilacus]|uniref:hypothetical protein n=1 Tax=Pseudidiomarina salilacus TaxID=3384452 RepID=UPI00398567C6
MTNSQKQLLWVAAILAALQFVVKPILAWQNELQAEVSLNAERLTRSEQLLTNAEELQASAAAAEQVRQELISGYPQAVESSMLQIQLQGELEALLRGQNVRIEQFDWMTGLEPMNSSLQGIRANISISGPLENVMQAHLKLMQDLPTIKHESIEIRRANRSRTGVRFSMSVHIPVQRAASASGGPA